MFDVKSFLDQNNQLRAKLPESLRTTGQMTIAAISKRLSKISKSSSLDDVHQVIFNEICNRPFHELQVSNIASPVIQELANLILSVPILESSKVWESIIGSDGLMVKPLWVFSADTYGDKSKAYQLFIRVWGQYQIIGRVSIDNINHKLGIVFKPDQIPTYQIESLESIVKDLQEGCESASRLEVPVNSFEDLVNVSRHVPASIYDLKAKIFNRLTTTVRKEAEDFEKLLEDSRFSKEYRRFLGV